MNALALAVWHLTGALRNAQLHRRAFCHAKRYPHRGRWVDGTKWPGLDGDPADEWAWTCAKCHRTLRRVSYAYTLAVVICHQERVRLKALTFGQRLARGEIHPSRDGQLWYTPMARQGSPDAGQALPPESPTTV